MTEFERFAQALAMTESLDHPEVWGDAGLACGRWQMHPAWVDEWWPDDIGVDWSWDHLFHMALVRFYQTKDAENMPPDKMAMQFHLGEAAAKRGDWDVKYGLRFAGFYIQLLNEKTA